MRLRFDTLQVLLHERVVDGMREEEMMLQPNLAVLNEGFGGRSAACPANEQNTLLLEDSLLEISRFPASTLSRLRFVLRVCTRPPCNDLREAHAPRDLDVKLFSSLLMSHIF